MPDDSSELIPQLKTIFSYAVVVAIGAYIGYKTFGIAGAAVGAIIAVPFWIVFVALSVAAVAHLVISNIPDDEVPDRE